MALGVGHFFERRLVFISDNLVRRSFQKGLHPILWPEARAIGLGFVVLKIVAGLFLEKRLFRIQLLKFVAQLGLEGWTNFFPLMCSKVCVDLSLSNWRAETRYLEFTISCSRRSHFGFLNGTKLNDYSYRIAAALNWNYLWIRKYCLNHCLAKGSNSLQHWYIDVKFSWHLPVGTNKHRSSDWFWQLLTLTSNSFSI